jgi:FKBP-type peptidyl-prolyl cis-trans isomerase FklB
MTHFRNILFVVLVTTFACKNTSTDIKIKNGVDSLSYAYGISLGTFLKNDIKTEFNSEAFANAMEHIYNESETLLTPEEANIFINGYLRKIKMAAYEKNLNEGLEFLSNNKKRKGVIELKSGLQYEVLKMGNGQTPKLTDKVKVHYKGTLLNGTVFDSSLDGEPRTFGVNRVIRGWTEALQLMPVGSKWRLYIPTELAYDMRPTPGGPIEPKMMLIFEVELLEIIEATTDTSK